MYEQITDENAYKRPMRIYPAPHYAMGGLWVDYNLQSNLPGLFVLGEANFSVHGANRLGASALMQGLADGYFVIPYTIANYLAQTKPGKVKADHPEFTKSIADVKAERDQLLSINGKKTVTEFHRELGKIMWDNVGMARSEESLKEALRSIPALREEFWKNVKVTGSGRRAQPAARERRPRRRLPRVRRAAGQRRPAPQGVLRRPLPRRVPVPGRRGDARRRELLPTSRPGSSRAWARSRSCTRSR